MSLSRKKLLRQQVCGPEILKQEGCEVQAFYAEEVDLRRMVVALNGLGLGKKLDTLET